MHYSTLVAVNLPQIQEDLNGNKQARLDLERLQNLYDQSGEKSILLKIQIGEIRSQLTAFSREVFDWIGEIMAPYDENTEDPEYIEFIDETEKLEQYDTETCTFVKLPNGRLVFPFESEFSRKYEIRNGKVYQRNVGPLKQKKRTKRAKRMKVLENYPVRKYYKSKEEYAENYCSLTFDEEYGAYCYYMNPNCFWDWYEIGGRWPEPFLVREDCTEYCISEDYDYEPSPAPEGYRWVCAARKRDIQWQKMLEVEREKATKRYIDAKKCFEEKDTTKFLGSCIKEEGLVDWGKVLYLKDETLQEFLHREHLDDSVKYPVGFYQFLSEKTGFIESNPDYSAGLGERAKAEYDWNEQVNRFIDELDDDCVLVGVDCHC